MPNSPGKEYLEALKSDIAKALERQSAWNDVFARAERGIEAAQRKEHPAQTSPSQIYAEGEHVLHNFNAVPCNTRPGTLIGSSPDPVVDMIEFRGRLWVATSRGVFVKRENEDAFDEVELHPAWVPEHKPIGLDLANPARRSTIEGGRAADEAAGLVPLHPNQTAERADPFVPNRFGEHG